MPQAESLGVKWTRLAAEQGEILAQNNLAYSYAIGSGVFQDYVQAHKWFSVAASRGHPSANKDRDKIAGHMTPDQVAEARRLAREWLAKFEARKKEQ